MRRQNRCCDQCRKAKRACDAPSVWDRQRFYSRTTNAGADTALDELPAVDPSSPASPCSNCLRRGKRCTFIWLKKRQRTSSRSQGSATSSRDAPDTVHSLAHPQLPTLQQDSPIQLEQIGAGFGAASVAHEPWVTAATPNQIPQGQNAAIYGTPGIDGVPDFGLEFEHTSYPAIQSMQIGDLDDEAAFLDALAVDGSSDSEAQLSADSGAGTDDFPIVHAQNLDYSINRSPGNDYRYYRGSTWPPTYESQYYGGPPPARISPYSVDYNLASNTNKCLITYNLMRVYNDSFELALACCLSPEVCPYDLDQTQQYPTNGISWMACHYKTVTLSKQYDPKKQDNGVYHAVTKLDQAAQACRLVIITKEQDKLAAKALLMTIMAYSTQWPQGSDREVEVYPQNLYTEMDNFKLEFDYFLHRTLWVQAKRALEECANIESFRVACAEWIMGLIQRPVGIEELAACVLDGSADGAQASVASQVADILWTEGPPLWTEQAARKVHALKFRYDTRQANIFDPTSGHRRPNRMNEADLGTFNLVYWMTVMLDSISSAMCNRPIVVSDSECQHDPEYLQHPQRELYGLEYRPHDPAWWADVFDQSGTAGSSSLQWPCPHEVAIKAFVAATPVKVIIFRQASHLQSMLRGKCCGEPIESVISNAVALCRHWNMTYGAFVRSFLHHYGETPVQLQMWFIHVVSYFYYGTLLFVDLIEVVDQHGLGFEASRQARQSVGLVARLRSECLATLSELARVSTMSGTDDLHFAIAKQSILPEPWTGMLIRAFAKAAMMQLDAINGVAQHDPMALGDPEMLRLVAQCESCVKALYCLGKKSDVARAVRRVLYSALNPYLMQTC